jgi:hypothetical protein
VDVSAPAFSSAIAAVWRSTCMETRFERSVGQPRWAVATCLARRRSVPRVSGPPWREGNRAQVGLVPGLAHPDPEHRDALAGQWRDALLSSFADRAHVRAGAEVDIGVGQREQLGDAQTGLHGGEQQRVIAASGPGRAVGAVEQRVDLRGREEGDGALLGAFRGDRKHPLDLRGVLGVAQRAVVEARVDRGEADVAGARAVSALVLEGTRRSWARRVV